MEEDLVKLKINDFLRLWIGSFDQIIVYEKYLET